MLVAGLAATPDVYRVGFGKPLDKIGETWIWAIANPIEPRVAHVGSRVTVVPFVCICCIVSPKNM